MIQKLDKFKETLNQQSEGLYDTPELEREEEHQEKLYNVNHIQMKQEWLNTKSTF